MNLKENCFLESLIMKILKNNYEVSPELYSIDYDKKYFESKEEGLNIECYEEGWTFRTKEYCSFITGNDCSFDTYSYCEFIVGDNCIFYTGNKCKFIIGDKCDICLGYTGWIYSSNRVEVKVNYYDNNYIFRTKSNKLENEKLAYVDDKKVDYYDKAKLIGNINDPNIKKIANFFLGYL